MIGTVVGNYKILARLAEGGMGEIYTAQHQLIGRMAAVKVLHPQLTSNKDVVNRFFNEARATTAINHPGIVEVFDFGHLDTGHAYLVMELLEGMTLTQWRRARGPISEGEAAMILRSVCSALIAAHGKGIVHRDLKPDNIFMVHDAESPLGFRTKLLDFGIAKLTDATGMGANATSTGAVMGTPTYMSPEQCRGTGSIDHRADLYSLGCIYYQLLSGRPPFDHQGAGELIGAHLFMQPDPVSAHVGGVSPDVVALIANLLQKQPEQRLQSARDLAGALAHIAQRTGWLPITSEVDVRLSVPNLLAPASDRPTAIVGDRGSYPSYPHPQLGTGPGTAPPGTSPGTRPGSTAGAPTTLSGAASQSSVVTGAPVAPKKRRGFVLPLAIGSVLAAGAVIAVVATRGPHGDVGAASGGGVPSTPTSAAGSATGDDKPAVPDLADVKAADGKPANGKTVDGTTTGTTADGKTVGTADGTVDGKTAGTTADGTTTTADGKTVGTTADGKTVGTTADGKTTTDGNTADGKTAGTTADGKTGSTTADGKTTKTTSTTGTKTTGTKTTGTKTTGTKTGTKTTTKKPDELLETDL